MKRFFVSFMLIAFLFIISGCAKNTRPDYDTLYDDYIVLEDKYDVLMGEYDDLREKIGNLEVEIGTVDNYFDSDPDTTFGEARSAYSKIYKFLKTVIDPE